MVDSKLILFGGPQPWNLSSASWTAVDDRNRGGSSQSYLSVVPSTSNVRFSGNLDTKTLGGVGFASETITSGKGWDLSSYGGLQIEVLKGDGKTYTLVLKDEVPEKKADGKEKSGVNWQYDFKAGGDKAKVFVPWSSLKPVYRGQEKKDAGPLKTGEIKRIGFMMRSFFGKQEGTFELVVTSISALKK